MKLKERMTKSKQDFVKIGYEIRKLKQKWGIIKFRNYSYACIKFRDIYTPCDNRILTWDSEGIENEMEVDYSGLEEEKMEVD